MKILTSSLILLILISTAYSQQNAGGYDQVVIASNQDPQSCLLHLQAKLNSTSILIQEDVYNPFSDCSYHDLQYVSIFNNQVVGTLVLAPTANPLVYEASISIATFQQNNGTACFNTNTSPGLVNYICKFRYGDVYLYFLFVVNSNTNQIATDWTGLWFPDTLATVIVPQNDTNVWKASTSQNANIDSQLYSDCGGWSTIIPSANNQVYVTGAIYNSQQVNLGPILAGMTLYGAFVHPRNTAASYIARVLNTVPFSANQTGTCSNLNLQYGAIANLGDCRGGCDVTFLLQGNKSMYTLRTFGFTYSGALRG